MRQSWLFRLLGLFMLPLYATGAWIAPALQVCPMHGSPVGAHAGMQMAASDNGLAQHSAHSANHAAASVDQSQPSTNSVSSSSAPTSAHQHGCDCLGCCAGSNGPDIPATQWALVAPTSSKHESFELKNAEVAVMRLEHVLPFATAPPTPLV